VIYLGDATQLSELHLISIKERERDQGDCQISNMIEKRFTGIKLKINPETDRVQIQLHLIVAMNPSYMPMKLCYPACAYSHIIQ
jgi:hypothetical protein